MHTMAQPPQLLGSLLVLTSQPFAGLRSQSANPGLQDSTQLPCAQLGVALLLEQATPQAPQLLGSVCSFTHAPLHNTCPAPHAAVQIPPVQLPLKHCAPALQAPPLGKRATQTPAEQKELPDLQTLPQAPQLLLSVCTFVQAPLQNTWPPVQPPGQAPLVQAWPVGQAVPQVPQFEGSEEKLVQNPLQEVPEQASVSP
jgi:hypothetical protein